jgi:hypothetical protein
VSSTLAAKAPVRSLLAGAIDYAGLFPPATLGMADAVRNYASYAASDDRWALGRFVVPAQRLDEFAGAWSELPEFSADISWRLAVSLGADIEGDGARVAAFNERHTGQLLVDAVEARASEANDVRRLAEAVPPRIERFAEMPNGIDLDAALRVARQTGTAAKIRTGGVIPGAVPAPADVIAFLEACQRAAVRLKATAGLHHPTRGTYRLTYEPDSPTGLMFGYLNVFLAATVIHAGGLASDATAVLTADRDSLRIDDAGFEWAGIRIPTAAITPARQGFITAFGSCSFREPIDELASLAVS